VLYSVRRSYVMRDGGDDGGAKRSRDEPKARTVGCKALKRRCRDPFLDTRRSPRRHSVLNYNPEYMLSTTIHYLYCSLSCLTTPPSRFSQFRVVGRLKKPRIRVLELRAFRSIMEYAGKRPEVTVRRDHFVPRLHIHHDLIHPVQFIPRLRMQL
jgi:hypothetical protein